MTFKFSLGDSVAISCSGEVGKVLGRAEYANNENSYYLRYKCTDGRAVQDWWAESALEDPTVRPSADIPSADRGPEAIDEGAVLADTPSAEGSAGAAAAS